MRKHQLVFVKRKQNIATYYKGKEVAWEKFLNDDGRYIKYRLGNYNGQGDYCLNGFAFKDLLYKNDYARYLSKGPELLQKLIDCLECEAMGNDFMKNSSYYCYEYRVPIDRVLFDEHDEYSRSQKQRYIVCCVCRRLLRYSKILSTRYMYDDGNPILRLGDHDILPAEFFVQKEYITEDMLR